MINLAFDRQRLRIAIKHLVDLLDEGVNHKATIKSLDMSQNIEVELVERENWLQRVTEADFAEMSEE